jgi:hypothetical protein
VIDQAAQMAVLGLPALRFVTTTNEEERIVMLAIARRAQHVLGIVQENQAAAVVNALAKATKRG